MEKEKIKNTIQRNIIITLVGGIFFTALLIGLISISSARNSVENEIKLKMENITLSTLSTFNSWTNDRLTDLVSWSHSARISAYVDGDTQDLGRPEEITNFFINLYKDYQWYEALNLAVAGTGLIASSNPSIVGVVDISEREYFLEALKGNTFISGVSTSKATGEPIFVLSYPLMQGDIVKGSTFQCNRYCKVF